MDFFGQQEQARRQSRTLVLLFALAVLLIVASVNLALALLWAWANGQPLAAVAGYPRGFFVTNTVVTLALIGVGTLIQSWNLRDGGDAVARMAGGRPVEPATTEPGERRLLNVVEEMALASGIACPRVYLLDREDSINAFAAGHTPNQAAVAVTRGALTRLSRDELQGVIGHEFSHILNGDMRLNIHLIGVLFGIQMIAGFGRTLIDFGARVWGRRGRDEKGPPLQLVLMAAGVVLFVIGYIGIFFGRLIKAAVSRQREFLADASAVQFTRNPDGIGGALRKIGGLGSGAGAGSRIGHPNAEQLSHLFLGAALPRLAGGWLATHPPLAERLRRIYGRPMEPLAAPEIPPETPVPEPMLPDIPYFAPAAAAASAAPAAASTAAPTAAPGLATPHAAPASAPSKLPIALANAAHDPQAAGALVQALLLDAPPARDGQLQLLATIDAGSARMAGYLRRELDALPHSVRLPLLDLAAPALRQLTAPQRAALLDSCERLIAADGRVTLAEFVVQAVLQRRLGRHAGRAVPVRFTTPAALRAEAALLLSLLAQVTLRAQPAAAADSALPAFLRGAAACPELALAAADLRPAAAIDFADVRAALERVNQLAPLAKPALVKAWLAAASDAGGALLPASADVLRALCSAIDAPLPPALAAAYGGYDWSAG